MLGAAPGRIKSRPVSIATVGIVAFWSSLLTLAYAIADIAHLASEPYNSFTGQSLLGEWQMAVPSVILATGALVAGAGSLLMWRAAKGRFLVWVGLALVGTSIVMTAVVWSYVDPAGYISSACFKLGLLLIGALVISRSR